MYTVKVFRSFIPSGFPREPTRGKESDCLNAGSQAVIKDKNMAPSDTHAHKRKICEACFNIHDYMNSCFGHRVWFYVCGTFQ